MKTKLFGLLILLIGLMYGCNESINGDGPETKSGKVTLSLTDAPFPVDKVEQVNVTIDMVRLKIAENEEDTDEGEEVTDDGSGFITLEVDKTFNLLELGNGESEILGDLEIPAGEYKEIRLHVVDAKIKLVEVEEEMEIKIPGGSSSGLKIKIQPSLVINDGEEYDVVLDFDVSRSFLVKGNPKKGEIKGFMFKPVIRATNMTLAGSLSGTVKEDVEGDVFIKNAHIYLTSPEDVTDTIATAKTNKDGFYKIIGIPGGTYTVSCEKEEYKNVNDPEQVEIVVGEEVTKYFVLKKSEGEVAGES
jgi:hypothetical protein